MRRLAAVLKDRCPRFGEDPNARLERYAELRRADPTATRPFPMRLWPYPFRLLRQDAALMQKVLGVE